MRSLPTVLCLSTSLLLASCATDRLFTPRENVNGTGPDGHPSAVYPLDEPAVGEVRLWSEGAERRELREGEVTRLHIGMELENTSSAPIRVDTQQMRIRSMQTDIGELEDLSPATVSGVIEARPQATTRIDLEFEPDWDIWPEDIDGFDLHWSVVAGEARYNQVTPFGIWRPDRYYARSPYWGVGWGWGWGWGLGWGWRYGWCY